MAEIHRARLRVGDATRMLVVKRILPEHSKNEDFVAMFRDEARLSMSLSHANVVQVFDCGQTEDGEWFLAMEYVHGQTLRRLMTRAGYPENGGMRPGMALLIAAEVARGLAYAHTRADEAGKPLEIVHRDVTPSNVLLSYEGEVKIGDFGIARAATRATKTQTGVLKGKPAYIAP